MGKRSNFKRRPRDFYPTPIEAVFSLLPHITQYRNFAEPCAGDGALVGHLKDLTGMSPYWVSDIEPQSKDMQKCDALTLTRPLEWADCIITNTPWDRKILHPMIDHFRKLNDTWLLLDSNWANTQQATGFRQPTNYLKYCSKIVVVGRVSWEGNGKAGMEDASWYCFGDREVDTVFHGHIQS